MDRCACVQSVHVVETWEDLELLMPASGTGQLGARRGLLLRTNKCPDSTRANFGGKIRGIAVVRTQGATGRSLAPILR